MTLRLRFTAILGAAVLVVTIAALSPGERNAAASPTPASVPVLVLRYFPTQDGLNLDSSVTEYNSTIAAVRQKTSSINSQLLTSLSDGSAYHKYSNASAIPSLQYSIIDDREFLLPVPLSAQFPGRGDKFLMFSDPDIGVSDICSYVDGQNVKEVWTWMYHTATIAPTESNMAMGTDSRSFWNYPSFGDEAVYGDVSNSARVNDLPVCQNTYVVYEYNYSRALGEALEDHGHQVESLLGYAQSSVFNRFTNPHGAAPPVVNHCGNVHMPPNTNVDYNWRNETDALSDCRDWRFDESGQVETVDCHLWYGSSCLDDGGAKYKVWWFQSIPGREYNVGHESDSSYCALRNWWDFKGDFDVAVAYGRTLLAHPNQDTSPPSISLTGPANGAVLVDSVTLSADAADAGCGLDRVDFTVRRADGGIAASFNDADAPYAVSWWTPQNPNGAYTISATATDVLGFSMTTSPVTVTTNNICSDVTGDGLVRMQDAQALLRYNGKTSTDPGFDAVQHYDLEPDGDIDATDSFGHWFQDCGFTDTTTPQVSFKYPFEGAPINRGGNIVIDVQSTDSHLTDRVQFYIDGAPASGALGLVPGDGLLEANASGVDIVAAFRARVDTSSWSYGAHTLGAQATDFRGLVSPIESVTVNVTPDSDNDGFNDGVEAHVGTDILDPCPDNTSDAAWPPDLNNDKLVNVTDISSVVQHVGKTSLDPDWNGVHRRYDLNADNQVSTADVDIVVAVYYQRCVPARVSNFTIDAVSSTTVRFTWSATAAAVSYERCVSDLPHTLNWVCVNVGNVTSETTSIPSGSGVFYYAVRGVAASGEKGPFSNRGTYSRLNGTVSGVSYNSYYTAYKVGGTKKINALNLGGAQRYLGFTNSTTNVSGLVQPGAKLFASATDWIAADWPTYYGPLIGGLESPNATLSPQRVIYSSTLCMVIDESLCP